MEAVTRQDDGELCGHVEPVGEQWLALTVFGGELGAHPTRDAAVAHVLAEGLASLAERWTLRGIDGDDEIVCIQEANPDSVTVALGYYSLPGVPTMTITTAELESGRWQLRR